MQHPEDILRQALSGELEGPHAGHEQRFEKRLLRHSEHALTTGIPAWAWMSAAAATIAALIIVLVVSEIRKTNEEYARMRLSDLNYEMARTEAFYEQRLRERTPVVSSPDQNITRLYSELRMLEDVYTKLEQALATNPGNQQVVDAMVDNYRNRLRIVELIQKYVEISNNLKNKQHESMDL